MKDSAMVYITRGELGMLLKTCMSCDPLPDNVERDVLHDCLDRISAEMGFTNWVEAYHEIP